MVFALAIHQVTWDPSGLITNDSSYQVGGSWIPGPSVPGAPGQCPCFVDVTHGPSWSDIPLVGACQTSASRGSMGTESRLHDH